IDRRSGHETDLASRRSINVDAVALLMLNLKEHKFVDELPVTAEPLIRCAAKNSSLLIGEMRLQVDESDHPQRRDMSPGLHHKAPVEVRLQPSEIRILLH